MRILFACGTKARFDLRSDPLGGHGGIEAANLELTRALAGRGHRVSLATASSARDEHEGVRGLALGEIGAEDFDVVVASNDARLFDRAGRARHKILWLHNPMTLERAIKKGQYGPIRRHRPRLAALGVTSEWQISHHLPFSSRVAVPYGLSAAFHTPLAERPRRDLFVWSSQKQRGLMPTLQAWIDHAAPQAPGAELHIFGTGADELPHDAAVLARARVSAHARTGKRELAEVYTTARGHFCPGAHDETFCLAAAEAQAMGVPVLSLGIGSLIERVQHGVNGLVVASHADLARAALDLIRHPALWAQLSQGAIASGRLYTWARAAEIWETRVLPQGV